MFFSCGLSYQNSKLLAHKCTQNVTFHKNEFLNKIWTFDTVWCYSKKPVSFVHKNLAISSYSTLFYVVCNILPSPVTINIVLLLECYVWEFSSFFYMSDCFLCKCLWFYVLAVLLLVPQLLLLQLLPVDGFQLQNCDH